MKLKSLLAAILIASTLGLFTSAHAVEISGENQWKLIVGGFAELDVISDSTRSLPEVAGNIPIDRANTIAGTAGRTQFTLRNSRLAFTLIAPKLSDWQNKAHLEFDMFGAGNPTGGAETTLYNNATPRVRHLYYQADKEGWQFLAGQTWMLFGWQPYYFMTTNQDGPVPGMLFSRNVQFRGIKSTDIGSNGKLQSALAVTRPPQRDSEYPGLEAGLRLTFDSRKSGLTKGPGGERVTQPMSIAVSGLYRDFAVPTTGGGLTDLTHVPGSAVAFDAMLPVISSKDGKDIHNTLSLLGEFTTGKGYGEQFSGWTGGIASPLGTAVKPSTAAALAAAGRPLNLDPGIGDYDYTGTFQLVQLRTFNVHFQYTPHFDGTWFDAGYGQLFSSNMPSLYGPTGLTSSGTIPYDKTEAYFANVFHQVNEQWRVSLEFDQFKTRYSDGMQTHDNRYQLSTWFVF